MSGILAAPYALFLNIIAVQWKTCISKNPLFYKHKKNIFLKNYNVNLKQCNDP